MRRSLRALATLACAASALSAAPGVAAAADRYVALGDSYSSGVGAQNPNLSLSCMRSTDAYPPLVAAQRPNTQLVFPACGGAKTDDVLSSQVNSLTTDTKLVSITIGGNDIGFADLIVSCTFGNCSSQLDAARTRVQTELPPKLDRTYAAIRARSPSARVAVLGYPRLYRSDLFGGCLNATLITYTERQKANALADTLRDVIRARATAAGFTFKDAIPQFAGHEVCTSTPYVNGIAPTVVDSYHPTKAGYRDGYTPLVRQVFG